MLCHRRFLTVLSFFRRSTLKWKTKQKKNLKEINKNTKLLHFLLPHFSELIKRIRFFLLYKNDVLRRRVSRSFSNPCFSSSMFSAAPLFSRPFRMFLFVPEWLIDFVINWHAQPIRLQLPIDQIFQPQSIGALSCKNTKTFIQKNRPGHIWNGSALAGNFNSVDWIFKQVKKKTKTGLIISEI